MDSLPDQESLSPCTEDKPSRKAPRQSSDVPQVFTTVKATEQKEDTDKGVDREGAQQDVKKQYHKGVSLQER
ncbi:unnamed protein product [marine sediment metagenome]|uniref:Uncharacterized protein n=1 Tax=marine sediment metagenome TaxID=412755 RepID=X0V313_9ZZZZ